MPLWNQAIPSYSRCSRRRRRSRSRRRPSQRRAAAPRSRAHQLGIQKRQSPRGGHGLKEGGGAKEYVVDMAVYRKVGQKTDKGKKKSFRKSPICPAGPERF